MLQRENAAFKLPTSGQLQRPYMMHFAYREVLFVHARQLRGLFKKFNVSTEELYCDALKDYYITKVTWPLKRVIKELLAKFGLLHLVNRMTGRGAGINDMPQVDDLFR